MPVMKRIEDRIPILVWTNDIDGPAEEQLRRIASLPFAFHHVAAMPDVHVGLGATIGSVIATKDAVIPAAVGVDIGCGMMLQKTNLEPDELKPHRLEAAYQAILRRTPVGFGQHAPKNVHAEACAPFEERLEAIRAKAPNILARMQRMDWRRQMGTLGGGNHFIELTVDEAGGVWVMLHSGSRGAGNVMAERFIGCAKELMKARRIALPDASLAYFTRGEPLFDDYLEAASWATDYAAANRREMMADVLHSLEDAFPRIERVGGEIDCHHNFVALERHFGEEVYVTRKGAIRASKGLLGIVPGSMGTASYLVEGLGSPESFESSAHGAGRRYGRRDAKERFTVKDLERETAGIVCRKDAKVIDEIPSAYKRIGDVMEAQRDLTRIVHEFHQVLCVKG